MYGDFPYRRYLVGVRCRPKPARAKNVLCILGALLGSERRQPFPPCLLAFPPCGEQSPTLSLPPDAHPRPNALTLDPPGSLVKNGAPYSVAPLLARLSHASHRRRTAHAFHPAGVRTPLRSCSPRHAFQHQRCAVRLFARRSDVAGVRLSLKRPARKKLSKTNKFSKVRGIGLMAIRLPFRFGCECHADRLHTA